MSPVFLDGDAGVGGKLHYVDGDGDRHRDLGEPVWDENSAADGTVGLDWSDSRTK